MKKPTGLLEQTGEGLEELNEWIFTELEKKKNEENKEYPEIKEKLLALEGIAQDILSKSSWNLTGQKNDPHFLFVKYLKNQILFHYLFTEKKSATEFIITSRVMAIAQVRALNRDLNRDLDLAQALAQAQAQAQAQDLARALAQDLARALDRAQARAQVQALTQAQDLDRAQAQDLDRAQAQDLDLARAQAQDLDRALDRALDLAQAQVLDLDLARAQAQDLARARALARALAQARAQARAQAQDLAQDFVDLDVNLHLPNYVPSSLKKSAETDLSQDKLLGESYIKLINQYSSLEKNLTKDPISLFERVLSSLLEIAKSWEKSDLVNHRKTLLDTSLQFIPKNTEQYESSDKNKPQITEEEPQVKYSLAGLKPHFDKQSEWEMVITIPGDFHRASDIGKLILTFAEGLETIPGVEIELIEIIQGSLIARLRIRFKDLFAKEGTKEVLKETARLAAKGKQATEDHYLSKPIEEVGKLKAERTKTERETYSEEEAQELRKLQIAKLREEVIKMRLDNIKSASELMNQGLLPIRDLQIDINDVLLIKKVNNEVEVNESWEEKLDQADGEIQA